MIKCADPDEGEVFWSSLIRVYLDCLSVLKLTRTYYHYSRVMRKPVYAICIRAVWSAHCQGSIVSLVSISELSSIYLASVAAQPGLSIPWSQSPKTGFLVTRLIYVPPTTSWRCDLGFIIFWEWQGMAIWTSNLRKGKLVHIMQGDKCPKEWYKSNSHSAKLCALHKFWMVESWILDTRSSDSRCITQWNNFRPIRIHDAGCLLASDWSKFVSLSTNQNLFNTCAISRNDRWTYIIPLDMYLLAKCVLVANQCNPATPNLMLTK